MPFAVVKEAAKITQWLNFTPHLAFRLETEIKERWLKSTLTLPLQRVEKYSMFKVTFSVPIKCISSFVTTLVTKAVSRMDECQVLGSAFLHKETVEMAWTLKVTLQLD